MRLYQKYFCYGSVFTSIVWGVIFYLYGRVEDRAPGSYAQQPQDLHIEVERPVRRFRPRHEHFHNPNDINAWDHDRPGEDEIIKGVKQDSSKESVKLSVDLSQLAIIKSPEDQKLRDQGYKLYAFNQLISDKLGFHRDVPDARHPLCREQYYPTESLPKASVVICFFNEAWSALLRTVYSVLDRSPEQLIHEIILVDDSSDFKYLGKELEKYVSEKLPLVKLIRTPERQGLIRARMFGAEAAAGEVLVFLDSHCEVNVNWLEPLLARIYENSHVVTIPIIDIINHDTFQYEVSPLVRGGFNWGLHFRWDNIPTGFLQEKADFIKPVKTPTMAGGLFAISKDYFNSMGKYDPGLDIWGGENLEISFRIWQCGGALEIMPCSRVGHIFRKRRPYSSPGGDTMTHNSLRVAHVWMDDYIEHFFKIRPDAKNMDYGDISQRVALRKSLNCRSFKWYLDNVYSEQTLPTDKEGGNPKGMNFHLKKLPKPVNKYPLIHRESGLCVVADGEVFNKKALLKLGKCQETNNDQIWHEMEGNILLLAEVLCMDYEEATDGESYPRLMKCHYSGGSQEWKRTGTNGEQLLNPASGKCLASTSNQEGAYLRLAICGESPSQLFQMSHPV